jgi:hypothetical protein
MPDRNAVMNMLRDAGVEVFTRKEWGTRYEHEYEERKRSHPMPSAPAPYHFLHITVTSDTDTVKQGKEGARQIEGYGLSTPPMVSYQDMITNEGKYFQGQNYGTKGTHTVNDKDVPGYPHDLNLMGYALAIMQNVGDEVTDEQVELAAQVFAARELSGWVRRGAPIYPHRKFAYKLCPGDKAVARLGEIQRRKDELVKMGGLVDKPAPSSRGPRVDAALKDLSAAERQAAEGTLRDTKLDRVIKILKKIPFIK